jgi:carbon-monoxide dehydrogenase medium subunit
VKPAPFDYHRAGSTEEAVRLLAQTGGKVLAGGQSLVPLMSMRLAAPAALVDINGVPGLERIEVDAEAVTVGAITRHRALELDAAAFAANPLLRKALRQVAHPTIRNRGTTVGSLAHADPAAEMPAVLAVLDGHVDALSEANGRRTIRAADLFLGPMECGLTDGELAVSATFPNLPPRSGSSWLEIARRHGDYAVVGAAAVVTLDDERAVRSARLALVSVGGTPTVVDVSEAYAGTSYDAVDWAEALEQVDASIDPETDIHASAEYRRRLARVLAGRALAQALGEALGEALEVTSP